MKNFRLSLWHAILIFYLALLCLSLFIQWQFPIEKKPLAHQQQIAIQLDGRPVEMVYIHFEGMAGAPSFWMLPDAFYGANELLPLAEKLNTTHGFDVILPVYPERDIENRSISASNSSRAAMVGALADSLGAMQADLFGYGYGGLIAIELAAGSGEKFRSLSLLSSYGVPELHFLGNHMFNRTLYSLLYPVVGFFRYGLPHMGYYHTQPLQEGYVRTLRHKDQRDISGHLKTIEVPALIMHPLEDQLVSLSVAEETHRLLPHSTLATHDTDQTPGISQLDVWIPHIIWFLENAEQRIAETRTNADPERVQRSLKEFDAKGMRSIGGLTLVLMVVLLILLSLISEDLACISGGLIAATGVLPFWYAVLGCYLGILFADVGTYLLGRWIGISILEYRPFKWFIKQDDVERAKRMFKMRGMEIIFATRFLPGTRFPVYLVAGIIKTNFAAFIGYFMLAISLWTPALVGVSALVGQPMIQYLQVYQDYALWIFLGIVLILYVMFKVVIPLTTVTGRRKLMVKWGRFREKYFSSER